MEQYGNLTRAAIELAKEWRTDRRLRRLEALLCVADDEISFIISGNGDVIEPENDIMAIGSGGAFAQASALALMKNTKLDAVKIAKEALKIASEICVYSTCAFQLQNIHLFTNFCSLFLGVLGGDWFFLSHDSSTYVIIGTVCFATKFLAFDNIPTIMFFDQNY